MKKHILIILGCTILFLKGCSYRSVHDTLHNVAKHNCRKIVNPQERYECETKHQNADYKSYRYEYEQH